MISMNIPVGVSDFVEIRRNGDYYIDKTALIAELLNDRDEGDADHKTAAIWKNAGDEHVGKFL